MTDAELCRLADTIEIRQRLAQHSRGIDRKDATLLKNCYAPGSEVAYGFFNGPATEFSEVVTAGAHETVVTMHRTSNQWIQVNGNAAVSESYVIAYTGIHEAEGGPLHTLIGGRYLDQHQRGTSGWRLTHRRYLLDWNMNWSFNGSLDKAFSGQPYYLGAHLDRDPIHSTLTPSPSPESTPVTNPQDLSSRVDNALANIEIHNLIMAQARATDRRDAELLASLFAPEATLDMGFYEGSAADYPNVLMDVLQPMTQLAHSVANEWIEVNGTTAVAESYVIAHASVPSDDGPQDQVTGGRYLDRFTKGTQGWQFAHRRFVLDWAIELPCSDDSSNDMLAALEGGGSWPDDPVYELWQQV